jgi:predicted Zn-dependent protease
MADELLGAGKLDDAAAVVSQLSRQLPLMPQSNSIHGEVLYRRGEFDGAVEQLYLAHVSDPASINLMLWLVRASARAGRDAYARHLLVNLLDRKDIDRDTAEKARALLKKLA